MYAKYEYNTGATQANVLADLVLILTGTTDPNSLSASCNKAATTITSTVEAGWTVHDANAGSGKQVLKAAYVDNGSAYKYAEFTIDSSTIQLHVNETWDAVGHTYTNKTGNTGYYQRWSASTAGRVYVFSSARFIALATEYSTTYGDSYNGMAVLAEISRNQPWNTVASGYPSVALISTGQGLGSSYGVYVPRAKNNVGADVIGISAVLHFTTAACSAGGWSNAASFPQGVNARVYDAAGNRQIPFFEILLTDTTNFVTWLGDISTISDIWAVPKDLMAQLETTTKNSVDYLAMQTSNTGHRWVFKKG